ncbi:MAG: Ppx/GppA family phosphatase [Hyphomonadaceae bacterium]|nr:Ppx/GppA family phosphatase [Hyphomonadaceae bacterium]
MHEAAVIDVGSNSVRLVAYRLDGRAVTPFLNEKVMAGLGRNMAATGQLSPDGVEAAIQALRRFHTLVGGLGVSEIIAVATAAVRDASDGAAFTERVRAETGITLRVIEGAEEARLSALGVLAGAPEARGVVGDLGGSSLELIEVSPQGPKKGETWRLGPLSLMDGQPFDAQRTAAAADKKLSKSAVLARATRKGDFYAVGGAWRALGRIDQSLRRHPLGVLHHHEMSRVDVLRVADMVSRQSRKSLERFEGAAAKRADTLPYGAVVLERVMALGDFDRVILSSYGLREGLLVEHLGADVRDVHPLVAGAEAFGSPSERGRAFGRALAAWIEAALREQPAVFGKARDPILRAAAARLADVGGALHPDHRGEIMFDLVLRAPFAGISHPERAYLAAAVHHRHTRTPPHEEPAYDRLLTDEQRKAAAVLGAGLRLGADLSGRSERILKAFRLSLSGERLSLSTDAAHAHLITEHGAKRLEALAQTLGIVHRVVTHV